MNRSVIFLLLSVASFSLYAGEPSTADQRKKLLSVARGLEKEPFGEAADAVRAWAMKVVEDASDIKVRVNATLLKELMASKIPDRLPVFGQYLLGQAAFVIEHPEQTEDEAACAHAAAISALRVYRKAVDRDAANKIGFWDKLGEQERAGTLKQYVEKLISEQKPSAEAI